MAPRILYISYDGMLEPLGQSQVLAYLERLATDNDIRLISFEKKADWQNEARRDAMRVRMQAAGIRWRPLRYHKSPSAPATACDIAIGTLVALWQVIVHRIDLIHARSYVAGVMALIVKRLTGARFLFDMRGFWADERVDGGLWPANGRLYRATKRIERRLLTAADHIVTLTHASEVELRRFPCLAAAPPPISVIPTCANLERFRPGTSPPNRPFVIGHVGSVGTWYLFDETLACFRVLREIEPNARLLVVNRDEQRFIWDRVRAAGLDPAHIDVVAAEHEEVPALIGRMSAGMAIIKPVFSKIASAPTKLAEYLGCGVPVLGNSGVGDVEAILESRHAGVALRGFSAADMREAVTRLVALAREPDIASRCRDAATELFSLERGVAAYQQIYASSGGREKA